MALASPNGFRLVHCLPKWRHGERDRDLLFLSGVREDLTVKEAHASPPPPPPTSSFRGNVQCMCYCNKLPVLWPSPGSLPQKFFVIGALSFLSSLVALHARRGGGRWAKRIPLLREKENNANGCLCQIFALRVRSAEWSRRVGWYAGWDRSISVYV